LKKNLKFKARQLVIPSLDEEEELDLFDLEEDDLV